MKVREIMTSPVVTVREDASLEFVAKTLLDKEIGAVPVVDAEDRLVGIVTENDFMARDVNIPWAFFASPKLFGDWLSGENIERIYQRASKIPVARVMSQAVFTVTPDDPVDLVVDLMLEHRISRVPVVDERGHPIGIVARRDLLRMMGGL